MYPAYNSLDPLEGMRRYLRAGPALRVQDGFFNSLRVGVIVVGGCIVPSTIAMMSNQQYTVLCNTFGAIYFGINVMARSTHSLSSTRSKLECKRTRQRLHRPTAEQR